MSVGRAIRPPWEWVQSCLMLPNSADLPAVNHNTRPLSSVSIKSILSHSRLRCGTVTSSRELMGEFFHTAIAQRVGHVLPRPRPKLAQGGTGARAGYRRAHGLRASTAV